MNFINKILNMLPDFDFTDEEGNTILHQAVLEDNVEMVISLLEKMKESDKDIIDIQNNKGNTAFHLAILNNNNTIAEILDKAGADKTIRNNDGEYVEDVTEDENIEVVDFQFKPLKCQNMNSLVEILNYISQLNKIPTLIIKKNDKELDNLVNDYLKQKGGYKKKIVLGTRKLN